jgi:hypothetical protein
MLSWMAARAHVSRVQPIIKIAISEDELMRLRSSPPFAWGFVSRSPSVAPSGRVRMNASQNNKVWDRLVVKLAAATRVNAPAKTSTPPSFPSPESSVIKSPRAVPSVFEKRIAVQ